MSHRSSHCIADSKDAVLRGGLRCEDAVAAAFERIESHNPEVNAFISLTRQPALKRARELDGCPDEEKSKLPLLGTVVGIKDNICTKERTTTCGSHMLENFVPPYDAAVVEAIEDAGGIIVGKNNLDEFAMGSSTETSFFSAVRNPHDKERIPGGSSGGSAAAVAARMVPVSLGSDTGGSIRQPSAHCGVVGLKPTYGRVSRYGLVAFASSLDQIGPITTCVRDAGEMLSVISVPDERDSTNARRQFTHKEEIYNGDVNGLTIGLPNEYFGEGLDSKMKDAIDNARRILEDKGAKVVDISLPNLQYALATYYIICTAEASSNLARYDGVKYGYRNHDANSLGQMYELTRSEGFGAEVKRRIMLGTYVLSAGYYDAYYLKAAKVRTVICNDFERAFSECDVLLSPVTPSPAFRLGEKCEDPLQMYLTDIYTVSANLAGIPALSVPCGTIDEVPVGAQLMASKWNEHTLLRCGAALEEVLAQD